MQFKRNDFELIIGFLGIFILVIFGHVVIYLSCVEASKSVVAGHGSTCTDCPLAHLYKADD